MKKISVLFAVLTIGLMGSVSATQAGEPSIDINAGPIWNNNEAPAKCAKVCPPQWNGQWTTTVQGKMSVCGTKEGVDIPVGPIWNNDDAQKKCPMQLATMKWNGQWRTTVQGKMSVCGCILPKPLKH